MVSVGDVVNVGMPVSTGPGTSTTLPFCTTVLKTHGCVSGCTIQAAHAAPEHPPIQSRQSGSCSEPITIVPPCGTVPVNTVVVVKD